MFNTVKTQPAAQHAAALKACRDRGVPFPVEEGDPPIDVDTLPVVKPGRATSDRFKVLAVVPPGHVESIPHRPGLFVARLDRPNGSVAIFELK